MPTKNIDTEHYRMMAGLLDFPEEGIKERAKEAQVFLDAQYPDIGDEFRPFAEMCSHTSLDDIQELYTRTFEVQAVTTLDLGYLLFGDDYKRAELLVNLNREHATLGNDCGHELADHLPNVVRLIALLDDGELRLELLKKVVVPGLKKMIGDFGPETLKKKNEVYVKHHKTLIEMKEHEGTIYQVPLMALLSILVRDFGLGAEEKEEGAGFLASLSTEMKIED
ncbi:MAG: hypothetical protein M9954_08780 [Cyclobacteriaceae bacterium]|nr:hypothetical protein [Cyclobacteriaceae bacterium]